MDRLAHTSGQGEIDSAPGNGEVDPSVEANEDKEQNPEFSYCGHQSKVLENGVNHCVIGRLFSEPVFEINADHI